MELLTVMLTYAGFGIAGFVISKKFRQPTAILHWAFIILLFVILSFVGRQTRVISVFQFVIYLSTCLVGLGIGVLTRFIYRRYKHKSLSNFM